MRAQSAGTLLAGISFVTAGVLAGCAPLPGPLEIPKDHGYGGVVVEHGSVFTDSFEVIFVPGDQPLTINKIELVDTDPALELVEVMIAGDKREGNFQFDDVYPPVDYDMGPLIRSEGAVLVPVSEQSKELTGYALVMGIKVKEAGRWVRGGYRLEYTIAGTTYAHNTVAQITVCTPDWVAKNGECVMDVPDE